MYKRQGHECKEIVREIIPTHFIAVDKAKIQEIRGMDEQEKKGHVAEIAKIHASQAFHREIESLIDQQVYFLAERALNDNELSFGRGTINGMRLIQERLLKLSLEHQERTKSQDVFDPYEITP